MVPKRARKGLCRLNGVLKDAKKVCVDRIGLVDCEKLFAQIESGFKGREKKFV